jgi:hypothetical protein
MDEERSEADLLAELDSLGPQRRTSGAWRATAEPSDDELREQLRSLGPRRQQLDAQESEQAGTSQLAQELESSGFIEQLGRRFAAQRQEADRQALDESRGWSTSGVTEAVRGFFGRSREAFQTGIAGPLSEGSEGWRRGILGGAGILDPEQRRQAAVDEAEHAAWLAPLARGVASQYPDPATLAELRRDPALQATHPRSEIGSAGRYGGDGISGSLDFFRGMYGAYASHQEERLRRAQAMLRGEAPLPHQAQWRSWIDTGARTVADMFSTLPIQYAGIVGGYGAGAVDYATGGEGGFQDNRLLQFGRSVERVVQQAFPGDRARQFEFSHSLVQGLASTLAFGGQGAIAHLLGAGPRGQLALIALSGMAAQTPHEFERVTQALNRGNATERDRIMVTLANSALGATEALPFAGTIGSNARGLPAHLAQGLRQGGEEMVQEFVQQGGQNVTRALTYDPDQNAYEGVLESMVVAAISGFGYGAAFSGRGATASPPPPAGEDAAVIEARAGGARSGNRDEPAPRPSPAGSETPVEPSGPTLPDAAQPRFVPMIDNRDPADPFGLNRFVMPNPASREMGEDAAQDRHETEFAPWQNGGATDSRQMGAVADAFTCAVWLPLELA